MRLTVPSAGSGSVTWQEDTSTVSTGSTVNFLETAGTLMQDVGGVATLDMTQYAWLAGRSGGQTLYGGTATSNTLTLNSNSTTTRGGVLIESGTYTNTGALAAILINPTLSLSGVTGIMTGLQLTGSWASDGAGLFQGGFVFWFSPTVTVTTGTKIPNWSLGYVSPSYVVNGVNADAGSTTGLIIAPSFNRTVGTETIAATSVTGINFLSITNNIGTSLTIADVCGINMTANLAGGRITNLVGLDMGEQTALTLVAAVRSAVTSGTGKYCIYSSGSAQSVHTGSVRIGDTTAPTQKLEVLGNILLDNSGTASELRFREPSASGSNYTAFKAQAQSGDITYTLPATSSAGILLNDGSGGLSWSSAGSGANILKDTSTGTAGPNNTVSETTVYSYSLAGGTLGTNGVVNVRIAGIGLNSGSARTVIIKVKYGSTTMITTHAESLANNATQFGWTLDVDLYANAATNAQKCSMKFVSEIQTSNGATEAIIYTGTAAEDSTTAKTIDITMTLSAATASFYFTKEMAYTNTLKQ